MKTKELIAWLQERDPEADVQIFGSSDAVGVNSYWDIGKVTGFLNSYDTVIEIGDLRCTS